VVKIVKIAVKYRMPITAFSGGTSLEGHYRGVSLLLFYTSLQVCIHRRSHNTDAFSPSRALSAVFASICPP
jgi:hypothetical protein